MYLLANIIGAVLYILKSFKHSRLVRILFWLVGIYLAAYFFYGPVATEITLTLLSLGMRLAFGFAFMIIQFVGIFWFMARTRTTVVRPGDPKQFTFADYWGQDTLKDLMHQWIELLTDRHKFKKMGGRPISGALLSGPPGTGKTMLAKCLAGEAGVAFIGMDGSSFRGMFWGVDTLKVMALFRQARGMARKYSACIIYIDEIDAIAMSRGNVQGGSQMMGMMGGGGMASGGLTRLLYEIDGLGEVSEWDNCVNKARKWLRLPPIDLGYVLVMGSTNRPDVIDPALLRSGRLDEKIQVDRPDRNGRRAIILGYLETVSSKGITGYDVDSLAADTSWATPADIMSAITKDAVRFALSDGRKDVTRVDIEQALIKQAVGMENPITDLEPEQRKQIAVHEASHAIVQYYCIPKSRVVHVTINRRSKALGFMLPVNENDIYTMPLKRLESRIMVSLAGHVGVELVLGEPWTGASSDMQHVYSYLDILVKLGYFKIFPNWDGTKGKTLQSKVDAFLKKCLKNTNTVLNTHRKELDALTDALLNKGFLSGSDVSEILEGE